MSKMVKKDDPNKLPKPKKKRSLYKYKTEMHIQNILLKEYEQYVPDLMDLVRCLYKNMKKYSVPPSTTFRDSELTDKDLQKYFNRPLDKKTYNYSNPDRINLVNLNEEDRIALILSLIFGCKRQDTNEPLRQRGNEGFDKDDYILIRKMKEFMDQKDCDHNEAIKHFANEIKSRNREDGEEVGINGEDGHQRRIRKKLLDFLKRKAQDTQIPNTFKITDVKLKPESLNEYFDRMEYENSGIHDIREWLLKHKKLILRLYDEDSSESKIAE